MQTFSNKLDSNFAAIWRNGVHFTNLHSGHIVIIMVVFSTIEYIERKEKNDLF